MTELFSMPKESWLRYIMRLAIAAAILYLIWQVRLVLIILLLGGLLAYVLRPLVLLFERLRAGRWAVRRGLATVLTFVLVFGGLLTLTLALLPPLGQEVADLKANFPKHREGFNKLWHSARQFYQGNLPPSVQKALDDSFAEAANFVEKGVSRVLSATFRGLGFVAELILVPILAFYFLVDAEGLRRQVLFFVPARLRAVFSHSLDGLNDIMYRYVVGQMILCATAFVVVSAALWLLHIKFWLLLGVVAGLTRAVPVIGPLLGGIPVVAAVLTQSQSLSFGLWVTVGFTLMHLFESKYLMPAILGRQLDLHPVLIIFALLVGAEFLGLIGMFIAVPVLAAIKFFIADYRERATASA